MIRRLQRSVDFERVLRTRSRASSAHFAVHHLAGRPAPRPARPESVPASLSDELSTGTTVAPPVLVDDAPRSTRSEAAGVWFGAVVPKRHARRAVTRTLLKRQIRSTLTDRAEALADGLWVVRLRAPFDRAQFASAASEALRRQARVELQQVLASAVERLPRR